MSYKLFYLPSPEQRLKKLEGRMNQVAKKENGTELGKIEKVLIGGDLSVLGPDERSIYYNQVCESMGLNPLTRPFEYITLNGKLTFYARKDATEQLRKIHDVSINTMDSKIIEGIFIVTTTASLPSGRKDTSTGAVSIANLKGDALANAFLKAETKSKRRVTLSICGLGMLDETEVETIPKESVPVMSQGHIQSLPPSNNDRRPSEAQLKRLYAISKAAKLTSDEVKDYIFKEFKKESSKDLSLPEYDHVCAAMQAGDLNKIIEEDLCPVFEEGVFGFEDTELGTIAAELTARVDEKKPGVSWAQHLAKKIITPVDAKNDPKYVK